MVFSLKFSKLHQLTETSKLQLKVLTEAMSELNRSSKHTHVQALNCEINRQRVITEHESHTSQ
jgi:hypothetical protein